PAAARRQRPAVQLDQVLDDGEAQSEAAMASRAGGVGLREALEQTRDEPLLDPLTRVGDRDDTEAVLARTGQGDAAAGGSELQCVAHEVRDDLVQALAIAHHDTALTPDDLERDPLRDARRWRS